MPESVLEDMPIHVRRAAANVGREEMRRVVLKTPKTEDSIRSGYLTAFVVEVLRRHRARQVERLGRELREDDFVFTRYDGRPWDPNEVSRILTRTIRGKNLTAKRLKAISLDDLPRIRKPKFRDRRAAQTCERKPRPFEHRGHVPNLYARAAGEQATSGSPTRRAVLAVGRLTEGITPLSGVIVGFCGANPIGTGFGGKV